MQIAEPIKPPTKWVLSAISFVFLYSLANSILYQWPLYSRAVSSIEDFNVGGFFSLATLFVFQLTISLTLLLFSALISQRLTKVICIIFSVCSSIAVYFIHSYGAILDSTMMGNVYNSTVSETVEFAHPKLFLYVIFLGLLPGFVILKTNIKRSSIIRCSAFIFITLIAGSAWIYINAKSWLWIDKNAKQFGGMILPWSYIVNSARYYDSNLRPIGEPTLLPDAVNVNPRKVVVVLVIGESARSQNFSLYGYARQTNPLLSTAGVVAMPNTVACSTYTTQSLRCILSHEGKQTSFKQTHEPLPSYLKRQGVEVIWRTNNFGEPAIKVNSRKSADELRRECGAASCERLNYDEVLLYKLEEQLLSTANEKVFVVLHQSGSHGPQYFKKYPPNFEVFQPACKSVDQQKCSQQELINAYDNSIVYTDYFLNAVVKQLKSMKGVDSTMLYVSDHGESLGEYGLYLHGTPFSIAPDFQKQVPFVAWMSESFEANRGLSDRQINSLSGYSHDNIFHSVMGGLGLRSDIYNAQLDIFSKTEKPSRK